MLSPTKSSGPTVPDVNEPRAKQIEHTWTRATGDVADPFAWMRDRDDPATISYLDEENAHTTAWFAAHEELVEELFGEIRSRVQETDVAAPIPKDGWFYATSTVEGQSYPIHARGPSVDTATEEVVLDQNVESAGHEFFDVGAFEISPDHRLAAWSADTTGDEHYTLRIRDIAHQRDLDDVLTDTTWAGVAWSSDGTHLFYVEADDQERPYRVMRHRLGSRQADDAEVFVDRDERFYVGVSMTRSREYIVIHSGSKQSSEAWLINAGDPGAEPTCVRPRQEDLEYQVEHWGDRLVVLTNLDAVDFRAMTAPVEAPDEWVEFVAHVAGRRITGIEPFADHLALHEWNEAQTAIRIVERDGSSRVLTIDAEPHDVEFGPNENWDTATLRLTHQSLTLPPRVIDVDVRSGDITVVKQLPTPNVDLGDYVAERQWAVADDGTRVPVDIVRHVDTGGAAPCCVYGYGSYEISMAPWFSVARLSTLR